MRRSLINITSAFLLCLGGCNSGNIATTQPTTPSPSSNSASQSDHFQSGLNKGMDAALAVQSARASEQWQQAAQKWQDAIDEMRAVPPSSSNHVVAQKKIGEYQKNLAFANQMANKLELKVGHSKVSISTPPNSKTQLSEKSKTPTDSSGSFSKAGYYLSTIDGQSENLELYNKLLDSMSKKCVENQSSLADMTYKSVEILRQSGKKVSTLEMLLAANKVANAFPGSDNKCAEVYGLIITTLQNQK